MFYSRFNEVAGLYDVFEDGVERAVNADLPIPDLPSEVNGIGIPASEIGRPLPSGAHRVGQSWSPHGIIVAPLSRASLGEATDSGSGWKVALPVALIAVGVGLYLWYDGRRKW